MTTNLQLAELAAEIRRRSRGQSPAMRKQTRRSAADFHRDLPGISDEVIGEVLLRAAVYASAVFQASPGASARDLSSLLGAIGQHLFHHPQDASEESPELGEAADDTPDDLAAILNDVAARIDQAAAALDGPPRTSIEHLQLTAAQRAYRAAAGWIRAAAQGNTPEPCPFVDHGAPCALDARAHYHLSRSQRQPEPVVVYYGSRDDVAQT